MPSFGRPGRTEIADAGLREKPLQRDSHVAAERAVIDRRLAAVRRRSGVFHQMSFVERDHAVEFGTEPIDQLLESWLFASEIGAEHRVGREQDARVREDRFARLESGLMNDAERKSHGVAVAFRVRNKLVGGRDMDVLSPTLFEFVVDEGVDLAAFADPRAVAVPVPFASTVGENHARRLAGVDHVFNLKVGDSPLGDHVGREMMAIRDIRRLDARHRRALDDVRRMGAGAPHDGLLHAIGGKDRSFLDIDHLRRDRGLKLPYIISI